MINNLNIILPLLEFKEEGDFYHLLILKRRKDATTNKSNEQSVRTIKTYTIRSKEYLEEKFEEIQLLCETFKARALFTDYSLIDTLKSYEQIITAQIGKENWEQWNHYDLYLKLKEKYENTRND